MRKMFFTEPMTEDEKAEYAHLYGRKGIMIGELFGVPRPPYDPNRPAVTLTTHTVHSSAPMVQAVTAALEAIDA